MTPSGSTPTLELFSPPAVGAPFNGMADLLVIVPEPTVNNDVSHAFV